MAAKYYCPKDKEQELRFDGVGETEEGSRAGLESISPERPVRCPVCGVSYYKWEAVEK